MELDTISIKGLRGYGYHGVLRAERELGQEFVVDLVLHLATARAAATDELADTVDYGQVASEVHALITGQPVALIEALAQGIAETCLRHTGVHRVEVTVHKPQAPVSVPFDDISVRIVRSR